MTERGHTSSMTSVTEYDSSIDSESDTTESSNSNITSSLLSSTDTDDKLTPSLGGISISAESNIKAQTRTHKGSSQSGKKRSQPSSGYGEEACRVGFNATETHPSKRIAFNRKHWPQDKHMKSLLQRRLNTMTCGSENFGVDGSDNLSTDLSDTSSRAAETNYLSLSAEDISKRGDKSGKKESDPSTDPNKTIPDQSQSRSWTPPWEPDMSSSNWYKAGCFSRYWSHYGFVMTWYRAHMDAVHKLHGDLQGRFSSSRYNTGGPAGSHRSSSARNNRRARRARNRRSAKAKRRAAKASSNQDTDHKESQVKSSSDDFVGEHEEEEEEEEVEMEITEDMMEFFTTSIKHRMERDKAKDSDAPEDKESENRINIEDAVVGQTGPSIAPPKERPGARRAQEMKQLYGTGAPMIHGMETALQMAFDRTQDKFQPKLWPNMPLKIVFG